MLIFPCNLFNSCTLPDRKIQAGTGLRRGIFRTNALCVRAFFVPKVPLSDRYAESKKEENIRKMKRSK